MIFTRKRVAKYSNLGIKINGKTLNMVDKVKFLGLIFDSRISKQNQSQNKFVKKPNRPEVGSQQEVVIGNLGYITLIRSRLDYGCQILYTLTTTSSDPI